MPPSQENVEDQGAAPHSDERALKMRQTTSPTRFRRYPPSPMRYLQPTSRPNTALCNNIEDDGPFELAVSAITSHWREVALTTPKL